MSNLQEILRKIRTYHNLIINFLQYCHMPETLHVYRKIDLILDAQYYYIPYAKIPHVRNLGGIVKLWRALEKVFQLRHAVWTKSHHLIFIYIVIYKVSNILVNS